MAEPSIRVSRQALKVIPSDRIRAIHTMYEDNDLDGAEEAESLIAFLEQEAPGTFVAILTNDSVTPSCVNTADGLDHFHCDHYEPHWYTCLVSKKIWDEYKSRVEAKDREWKAAHQCRIGGKS